MYITASKLYDYTQCPHRVWRDIYGPKEEKIKEINPFVQMLWDKGISYEKEVISKIGKYLDLSEGSLEERFKNTIKAMKNKTPLIYQGVLIKDNLRGIPDLLKITPDGQYVPLDIKSGMGREGANMDSHKEGKLKPHYAIQLALYVDLLNRLGFENVRNGVIFDIKAREVMYDLNSQIGVKDKKTFWELYENTREIVSALLENKIKNKPAMAGICKLCPWYDSCKKWVEQEDDLTGLFCLGRSKRDTINEDLGIKKIADILSIDIDDFIDMKKRDKQFAKGIAEKTLKTIIARADIVKNIKKPTIYNKVDFPKVSYELFFDIESDPTHDFVYMHGIYERSKNGERFLNFTAKEVSIEAEKKAWIDFWKYIKSLPRDDFSVYYYSFFEKTTYRNMQKKYPDVVSEKEVEDFFINPNVIDLYTDVIYKNTDWPLGSYSIKAIAQYLGFKWKDETPSGALSIQWFNDYLEKKDEKILKRILLYNEDDCKATMILKDALQEMSE